MSSPSTTNYLVTGGNRGIGLGFVSTLLLRPSSVVIAAVRDLNHDTSKALSDLPTGENSRLIVVKVDSTSDADAEAAVASLQKEHHISKLDVVIANSGIAKHSGPAVSTPVSEIREHFEVNAVAPLLLFQASWPLLEKSDNPKFVTITSAVGSIGDMDRIPWPTSAYGTSKAAVNYLTRKIHFENEKLIAFPIHPGHVQSDMGNRGAQAMGQDLAPVTIKQSVDSILAKIDNATRAETSGTFQSFNGSEWKW